jgi:hypothetical protein
LPTPPADSKFCQQKPALLESEGATVVLVQE